MASLKLSSLSVADPPSFLSNLTFESCLGQGGFGTVLKAIDKNSSSSSSTPSPTATAVKLIFSSGSIPHEERQIMRETTLAINFNHENIIKILAVERKQLTATEIETILKPVSANNSRVLNQMDVFMSQARRNKNLTADCICIQMQLCGKNLRAWLNQAHNKDDKIVQITQIKICLGMASGLKYLHDNKILHRDLKPENILFSGEKFALPVKIGDFGLCRVIHSPESQSGPLTSRAGTQEYMAPEAFTQDYSFQADLFSLGLVMWEVVQPIKFTLRRNLFDRLVNDKKVNLLEVVESMGAFREIIEKLTKKKKTDRMQTADEVLRCLHFAFSRYFVASSKELVARLRNVQKGGLIVLSEGLYEGAFLLEQDNVEIVGAGGGKTILKGLLENNACLEVRGSDCKISDVKVISGEGHHSIGIDVQGSRNTIRNVEASGGGTGFKVRAEGNRLESLTISDAENGIFMAAGGKNVVDHVKIDNIRNVGITFNFNSDQNTISNVTATCTKYGIWVGGSSNNFFNIAHIKQNSSNGFYGMHFSKSGSNNCVSNLTCWGYSKDDYGLGIQSSDTTVKDSICGPVWVLGENATLTNVDCREELKIRGAATGVSLTNCRGQELRLLAPRKGEVATTNCNFHKIIVNIEK